MFVEEDNDPNTVPEPTEAEIAASIEADDAGEAEPGQVVADPLVEGASPEPVTVSKEDYDQLQQQLAQSKTNYDEAHRTITRQAQELSDSRKTKDVDPEKEMSADEWLDDPAKATKNIVTSVLTEFEKGRQEERQAERQLEDFAEQEGIPVKRLRQLSQKLAGALATPEDLLGVLKQLHQAETTHDAVASAAAAATDTAARNARAVTVEGNAPQTESPDKSIDDMTDDELEKYVIKKYGIADERGGFQRS